MDYVYIIAIFLLIIFIIGMILFSIFAPKPPVTRNINLVNKCPIDVVPQLVDDKVYNLQPIGVGDNSVISIPSSWKGKIVTQFGCDVKGENCASGTCTDAKCDIPATIVEIFPDKYSVSLANGYNLPVSITGTTCQGPTWTKPIYDCPPELVDGENCMSMCLAYDTSEYCCTDQYACNTGNCNPSSWENETIFSSACPECKLSHCDKNFECSSKNLTITFCQTA